jgi:hypothetical protein
VQRFSKATPHVPRIQIVGNHGRHRTLRGFATGRPNPRSPRRGPITPSRPPVKKISVLGGHRFNSTSGEVIYYASALRSVIGADGSLSAWSTEPSFQSGRSGASAARVGDCLFLTGGSASGNYCADTQSARIQRDGAYLVLVDQPEPPRDSSVQPFSARRHDELRKLSERSREGHPDWEGHGLSRYGRIHESWR